ncbi:glycosyltransferase family 2 protein [Lacimonas salitolerans]|uniref:Glycosyltransferase family 2 protein n=1 Tax=Lacimonas salitolerans TaxID=1323750 RepID=A0ABW4EGL1_9RHOB
MPRVSVIIPAYRAGETLPAALASVAAGGVQADMVEVVIAPDDGHDYADLPDHGLTIRRCATHHMATGAGPARNRAIAAARGDILAFLDADDLWAPGYLAALVPLAETHGAAFGRTGILRGETKVLDLPAPGQTRLAIADFACGASFHPVLRRDLAGPFRDRPSQDVLHAIEVLSLLGGSAPLGEARYLLHLNTISATADRSFAARVQKSYHDQIRAMETGQTRIRPCDYASARATLLAKAGLNRAYMRAPGSGQFYDFLRTRQPALSD